MSPRRIAGRAAPLLPLAAIALVTALAHLALIDAVAASAPPFAVRPPSAVRVTFVAAPPIVAAAAPSTEPVPPAVAPADPPVVGRRARPARRAPAPPAVAAVPPALEDAPVSPAPPPAIAEPAALEVAQAAPPEAPASADALTAGPASAEPPPVYPTRIPDPFHFVYDMSRGFLGGRGELALRLTAEGYEARLGGSVAGFSIIELISRGTIDEAGFAPLRYTDQRRGRAVQAANFQRASERIIYSGTKVEAPLPPGTQDRLSWMLQLAAIARARPQRMVAGEHIVMFVSGARGDADTWIFEVGAPVELDTPAGMLRAVPLQREARKEHDTRAQVWLDPTRQYLPVKARLWSSREGADALVLVLREVQPP